MGGANSRGRTGVGQPVPGLSPSAVCFTAAMGGANSRGRPGVEQPVPDLLPAPSVLRRRWAEQSGEAAPASNSRCQICSQRRLFYGGAGRQRDQPRPHRRQTTGASFASQRRLFYGGAGQCNQPRPPRCQTTGARFSPSAVCSTAALGSATTRGRPGVKQPVSGLPPSAVCFTAALGSAICSTPAQPSPIWQAAAKRV